MNEQEMQQTQDESLKSAVIRYASYQPFVGLCSSATSALIQLILRRTWTLGLLCYTLIPLFGFCVIYLIIATYMKSKHAASTPFINKKVRSISLLIIILLVCINLAICFFNRPKVIPTVSIDNISTLNSNLPGGSSYFIIFSSNNCTYCRQMEPVFAEVYANNPDVNIYYCDLSFESTTNPSVTNRDITTLPLLICYQGEKEVDRIEGVASLDTVNEFINP